jgi:two-component system sensor kinase FixL
MSPTAENFKKGLEDDSLFSVLVGTAVDGIMVIDERATVRFYNDACERLFGYAPDEVLGRNVKVLMPAPYRVEHDGYLGRYLSTGEKHIIGVGREVVGQRKDGSTFPMYLSVGEGHLGGQRIFVGIVHDISDRHRRDLRIQELQGELLHVTRMTAMGQMSSALAHELNQPLTAILSYSKAAEKMAETLVDDVSELPDVLNKIAEQAARAGHIIRRLRAFVEKREPNRLPEDVNQLVEESVALGLVGIRDVGIRLKVQLEPDLPRANVDKIEIQQVMVNLMRNAAEAMLDSETRELTISTDSDGGGYVTVTVADTGPGLAPDVARRLFEPFVSSKSNGMGMGLNICRTIIEAHGGRLWSDPNPAGGAIFRFRIPVYEAMDDTSE